MKIGRVVTLALACAAALSLCFHARAQNLTLEGQTGGFITPTAYVVYTEDQGHFLSHIRRWAITSSTRTRSLATFTPSASLKVSPIVPR